MIQTRGSIERAVMFVILAIGIVLLCISVSGFMYVILPIAIPILFIYAMHLWKTITMDEHGCTVSLFRLQRFYPWSSLKTIRFLDFGKARFSSDNYGGYSYCEGVLFCTRKIKVYPQNSGPDDYIFLHYPFSLSCFYIQFTPTKKYIGSPLRRDDGTMPKELPCTFPVDRARFLSCIEEWGVKVEGLNVPYPPEELEAQKKKRR